MFTKFNNEFFIAFIKTFVKLNSLINLMILKTLKELKTS